jgi:predicted enzyme related to lactoylglutathione lyase
VALGIANVWLPVVDTDRAVQFYEGTLGLSLAKRDGDWAEVETDGLRIGLNGREPEGAGAHGGPVVTFQPDNGLEAAIQDLEGKGVDFAAGISEHPWGRVATFQDPDGNDLQLYEPPAS